MKLALAALGLLAATAVAHGQVTPAVPGVVGQEPRPDIHIIYMGGNDCPPCVAWRATELPKLKATEAYKAIRFSSVTKAVRSPVPARLFLPDEVKPYKDQLDKAGGGRSGSPQVAVLVDGKVYDYYFGTSRGAEELEKMITAIQTGGKYPFKRCLERAPNGSCAERP